MKNIINSFIDRLENNKTIAGIFVVILLLFYFSTQYGLFTTAIQNDDSRIILPVFFELYGFDYTNKDALDIASMASAPVGYKILHYIASPFISIMVFPKIIQIVCFLFMVFFAFKIGRLYFGYFGGVLSIWGMVSATWIMGRLGGGNPRAFGPVLYMALLYFCLRKNTKAVFIVALAGAFFYPQIMLVSLVIVFIIYFFNIVEENSNEKKIFKSFINYIYNNKDELIINCAIFIIILIISSITLYQNSKICGGFYTIEEAKVHSSFDENGRLGKVIPLEQPFKYIGYIISLHYDYSQNKFIRNIGEPFKKNYRKISGSSQDYTGLFNWKLYLSKLILPWLKIAEWDSIRGGIIGLICYGVIPIMFFLLSFFIFPREIVIYIGASLIVYLIANITAFSMYDPGRFISYPISVLLTQFFIIGFGYAARKSMELTAKKNTIIMIVGIYIILILFSGPGININSSLNVKVQSSERGLFEYIEKHTGINGIIAGNPNCINSIPLFTQRRVLINSELAFPWWKKINEEVVIPRLTALCKAYFSGTIEPIKKLKSDFNVDYIVVYKQDFSQNVYPKNFIFAPYSEIACKTFQEAKSKWILKSPSKGSILYEDSRYVLVDISKIL